MFRFKPASILVLGALAATLGSTAMAVDKHTNALLSSRIQDPLGMSAPDSVAQRSINLSSNTKYVNVEQGEVIQFLIDGKAFTWHFDTLGTPAFKLAAIAPKDVNVGNVLVYVQAPSAPELMLGS